VHLFSDYYLKERLPLCADWLEDPEPTCRRLRDLCRGAARRFAGQNKGLMGRGLVEPMFRALGFEAKPGRQAVPEAREPDYRLFSSGPAESPVALCLVYPWGRSLDATDYERDQETKSENPGAVAVSLLEKAEAPWVIITNGNLWRLYSQRTRSRATTYYEIDLNEILAGPGPPTASRAESFRYFWLIFRQAAFEPAEVRREGKTLTLSFLDRLLLESENYAREAGDRLKDRIFERIFPDLAAGFIQHLRQEGETGTSQHVLDRVFQGTLTLLYRLLFVLYAEARDLLPARECHGYFEASFTNLKTTIADIAGAVAGEARARLEKRYRNDGYALYARLSRLFRIIDKGDAVLNVPVYHGGLFLSDPALDDASPETKATWFLQSAKVPDRFLARAIDLLAREIDPERHELVFIDYKSLDVRQFGSIYERLLAFKLRIATEKLAIVSEKNREFYVPFGKLAPRDREQAERQNRIIKCGELYLENDKRERKASASYYTPDHIVKYIVEEAVGPVLRRKFEAMRPRLYEAQKWHREMTALARAKEEPAAQYESGPVVKDCWGDLLDSLFSLKVLDPAMGSGHFLVETVDFVTDKTLDFLNAFPWNPVVSHLTGMREAILNEMDNQGVKIDADRLTLVNLLKRHVLKHCIYGVDLNPMAVELAKVSLWLNCFTLGAPLSFLDHHLRCGNSLIGVSVEEVRQGLREQRPGDPPGITSARDGESRSKFREAAGALTPLKRILDVYASQWFGNSDQGRQKQKRRRGKESSAIAFLRSHEAEDFINARTVEGLQKAIGKKSPDHRAVIEAALQSANNKRFFHWELEFPEVFCGPAADLSQGVVYRQAAGFDAVIGNPPYDVLAGEELGYDVSDDLSFFKAMAVYAPAIRGKNNLYKLFICRGISLLDSQGWLSFVVPMPLLGDNQAAGVRKYLLQRTGLSSIETFPQKDDPCKRVFPDAKLPTAVFVTRAGIHHGRFRLRTHPGRFVETESPQLELAPSDILAFDPETAAIPSCTQADWELVVRVTRSEKLQRLALATVSYQGEVNETNERRRGTLSSSQTDPVILRGSNICMYAVREASQGEEVRLNVKEFLKGKEAGSRAFAHQGARIGFQRKSPQNNFRRLIAAPIPKGKFCMDSVSYVPENSCNLDPDLLLALLQSKILEWYFRLGSTNALVNEYQFNAFPVPAFVSTPEDFSWMKLLDEGRFTDLVAQLCNAAGQAGETPQNVADALAEMSRRIQQVERNRVLKSRSARSRLAPEAQPIQDAIDAVLFKCYGLTPEEGDYISRRLEKML
jgi:hypothetical protein